MQRLESDVQANERRAQAPSPSLQVPESQCDLVTILLGFWLSDMAVVRAPLTCTAEAENAFDGVLVASRSSFCMHEVSLK